MVRAAVWQDLVAKQFLVAAGTVDAAAVDGHRPWHNQSRLVDTRIHVLEHDADIRPVRTVDSADGGGNSIVIQRGSTTAGRRRHQLHDRLLQQLVLGGRNLGARAGHGLVQLDAFGPLAPCPLRVDSRPLGAVPLEEPLVAPATW